MLTTRDVANLIASSDRYHIVNCAFLTPPKAGEVGGQLCGRIYHLWQSCWGREFTITTESGTLLQYRSDATFFGAHDSIRAFRASA